MEQTTRSAIAAELAIAHKDRRTIPLLSKRWPDMTIDDSYAVQAEWVKAKEKDGHRVVGHKIGLTSRAMQVATGITEPDYGTIFEDQVYESGAILDFDQFSNVRVEVELAFHLKCALEGDNVGFFEVLEAIDYVIPALEILSSRVELEGRTIVDTIADNAALGAILVGPGRPIESIPDLAKVAAVMYKNETIEESGVAAAVLGHPVRGVEWLVKKLAAHGTTIDAGEIVLAGSFTKPMWVGRGDVIFADFGTLGLLSCRFA